VNDIVIGGNSSRV